MEKTNPERRPGFMRQPCGSSCGCCICSGPQGPQGEPGEKGEKGAKGDKGDKGDTGAAGRGIDHMEIIDGELWVTYTDGTTEYVGDTEEKVLKFTLLPDGTYGVEAGPKADEVTSIVIPSTYHGKPVTQICDEGFDELTNLQKIVLPNTLKTIGKDAFSRSAIESIEIPSNVNSIGSGAFQYCNKLVSVVISEGVKKIGGSAFAYCKSLTSITFPEGIEEFGSYVVGATSLTSITIPKSCKKIGANFILSSQISEVHFLDPAGWLQGNERNGEYTISVSVDIFSDPKKAAQLLNTENPQTPNSTYAFVKDSAYAFAKGN